MLRDRWAEETAVAIVQMGDASVFIHHYRNTIQALQEKIDERRFYAGERRRIKASGQGISWLDRHQL